MADAAALVARDSAFSSWRRCMPASPGATWKGSKGTSSPTDIKWHLPGRHPLGGTRNGANEVSPSSGSWWSRGSWSTWTRSSATEEVAVEVDRGHTEQTKVPLDSLKPIPDRLAW